MTRNESTMRSKSLENVFFTVLIASIVNLMALPCQAQIHQTLLALSKADHTLAIVDPGTLTVLARIPVGNDPHEVTASPDGKTAYVANYGGGTLYEINVIDLVNHKPLQTIDTRPLYGPHDVTFVGNKLWFTAEGSKAVGRYDPSTGKLDWSMGTGQDRTHMLFVTPDSHTIYTTNVASGTVSILADTLIQPANGKAREDWNQTVIPVGRGSEGFDVLPGGKKLWTVASDDGVIYCIDVASKKVEKKIAAHAVGANRLKFTPDGKRALISSIRTGDLFVYDVESGKEIKKINVGNSAAGILIVPDGSKAFVACSSDNYIALIDLTTFEIVKHVDAGKVPDGMAWVTPLH